MARPSVSTSAGPTSRKVARGVLLIACSLWVAPLTRAQAPEFVDRIPAPFGVVSIAITTHGDLVLIGRTAPPPGDSILIARITNTGELVWQRTVRAGGHLWGSAVAAGADGQLYAAGGFHDWIEIGDEVLRSDRYWVPFPVNDSTAASPYFTAAFDADGSPGWARKAEFQIGESQVQHAAAAPSGVIVGGYHEGAIRFGEAFTEGGRDGFVASYSSAGTLNWGFSVGGENHRDYRERVMHVAADPHGNAFVMAAVMSDSVHFADTTLIRDGISWNYDYLIGKIDVEGRAIWAHLFDVQETSTTAAIATDRHGNLYVTGEHTDTLDLGGASPPRTPPTRTSRLFLAKYDGDGVLQWVRGVDGEDDDGDSAGLQLVVDAQDHVHLLARLRGTTTIDGDPLPGPLADSLYLLTYTPEGALQHVTSVENEPVDAGLGDVLAYDREGLLYVAARSRILKFRLTTSSHSASPDLPGPAHRVSVYPNPGTGPLTFEWRAERAGDVRLQIYDLLGRTLPQTTEAGVGTGLQRLVLDAATLAPGVFAYRLDHPDGVARGTFTVVRQ